MTTRLPFPVRCKWSPPGCAALHRLALSLGIFAASSGISAEPAPTPVNREAVTLPAFTVTETPEGLPWLYGRMPGVEILSTAGSSETYEFMAALWRGRRVIAAPELLAGTSVPTLVVLYRQPPENTNNAPPSAEWRPNPQWAEEWRMPGAMSFQGIITLPAEDRLVICGNLWNVMAVMHTIKYELPYLVRNRTPAWPEWLRTALVGRNGLYQHIMVFPDGNLLFARLPWPAKEDLATLPSSRPLIHGFLPWNEIFERSPPRDSAVLTAEARLWQAQSALFLRWGLFQGEARARAFWQFAYRAIANPVDEGAFRAAFGLSYEQAARDMETYLRIAREDHSNRPAVEPPSAPDIGLRPATEAEIGRMKGEWERVQGEALRGRNPGLAEKYLDLARRTFHRASTRTADAADPDLAAALGLYSFAEGDREKAREYLEAAFKSGNTRPAACLRLAELRYDEALGAPAAAKGTFSDDQTKDILTPLFVVRGQEPVPIALYQQVAAVWLHSASAPTPQHLAVLEEGLRLFPRDTDLARHAAEVFSRHGLKARAEEIIQRRLRLPIEAEGKDQLEALSRRLKSNQS